jgi:hypothetical protein
MEFSPVSRFFCWSTIKTNGKTQKLSSKHVSGGERARRARIFLEKIKISEEILGFGWHLHGIFSSFKIFFGWRITTNGKI